MNARRRILSLIGASLLCLPCVLSFAQEAKKLRRVGVLAARRRPASLESDLMGEFPRALRDLGYTEGKNLSLEWRFAENQNERLPDLAADLIRQGVEVIVAIDGTPATLAAQKVTNTIPIVFATAGDPVGNGLVKSLAHPGGNTTGISLLSGTSVKQVEMLVSMLPKLSLVGALFNPTNPYAQLNLKDLDDALRGSRVRMLPIAARNEREIEEGFSRMASEHAGAFIVVRDSFTTERRNQIAELAARRRLPGMAGLREAAEAGLLMSYGVSPVENYRRAAAYVDKILKGARPAELPVEQPTRIELVLNRKTARAFGLEFPPDLLVLADKVIE